MHTEDLSAGVIKGVVINVTCNGRYVTPYSVSGLQKDTSRTLHAYLCTYIPTYIS